MGKQYYRAFGEQWFKRYQDYLLFLLNAPVIRYWFRWILRINKDCKYNDIIIEIEPNNYKVLLQNGNIRADFRTHDKFSKRIYYAFKPLWWTFHYLDELIFDRFVPEFSFGFSTLTAYPDAGSGGGNTTCDGRIYRGGSSQSFSSIISNAGSSYNDTAVIADAPYLLASSTTNEFIYNMRFFATFNTNIGESAVITQKKLSLYIYAASYTLGNYDVIIVPAVLNNANALSTSDYNHFTRTNYGSIAISSVTSEAYNDISISDGLINKTVITQLALISSWDFNQTFGGTWVANKETYLGVRTADNTGNSLDPKLVIEYSTTQIKTVCGVDIANVKNCSDVAIASIKSIMDLS